MHPPAYAHAPHVRPAPAGTLQASSTPEQSNHPIQSTKAPAAGAGGSAPHRRTRTPSPLSLAAAYKSTGGRGQVPRVATFRVLPRKQIGRRLLRFLLHSPTQFPWSSQPAMGKGGERRGVQAARARWRGAGWLLHGVILAVLPLLAAAEAPGRYRAVFNFGDSLVDAGNLVTDGIPDYLATARLPYGQTYFSYPTGRCSDGRLVVDFIAQELGLPLLPPSKAKNATFARGANFAITGATALDTNFFQKRGLGKTVWNSGSLFTQIQWLRDLKPSLCNSAQECKEFFAESLFVVGEFGGNDYNAPLFAGKDLKEAYKLMPHVIQGISDGVEQLIAEGAKDLIVPGVMPSGCFPVYLTMYADPKEEHGSRTGCLKRFNTFSWVHNSMLKRALEKLCPKHPGVRIIYGDYFTPVIQFILQPEKFGFYKQLPRACCGAPGRGPYNFNLTAKCGEPGATPCADPKTHWSWDGVHLTEAAYRYIARGWLYGPYGDQPIVQSS